MSLLVSPDIWAILTIRGEAGGEPYQGKLAVGEVIRERARRSYNCDGTVTGACLAPLQFSCWNAHSDRLQAVRGDDTWPDVQDCIKAWGEAQNGSNVAHGAVLYYAESIPAPDWAASATFLIQIGKHRFYGD